ncbi:hypothetical protein HZI73_08420 [Vallitalea pronyensis]|uniref:Uncharacterized protein n=1 Tax=Vallitalea pronyensis TaxID=1348613 RepID=A0A8J8MI95_9FIRM|nr:hypothetical protein [Vallitalea pronyensis]QUI22322.1 hypothetical protein HZI73_08420 [Vallitalea pronyensis]
MKKNKWILVLTLLLMVWHPNMIHAGNNNDMDTATKALTCDHIWEYSSFDDETHCKSCSECLDFIYENHTWGNTISDDHYCFKKKCLQCEHEIEKFHHIDSSQHYYDDHNHWYNCLSCSRRLSEFPHSIKKTSYNATTHKKECFCGYFAGYEKHNMKVENVPGQGHRLFCDSCNYSINESHAMAVRSLNKRQHEHYCITCDYKESPQDHTWENGICTKCGEKECDHLSFTVMGATNFYHAIICTDCAKIIALEPHNFVTNALGYTYCEDCGMSGGDF